MQDTRIDLGWANSGKIDKESRPAGLVPLQWFRRRKTMILAGVVFFMVVLWLQIMGKTVPWRSSPSIFVDPEIAELLRTIPGAVPGNIVPKGDALADAGHGGKEYPSREDMILVLLKQLRDPSFRFPHSQWPTWSAWIEDGSGIPRDAHVQFVTELKRLGNGTEDARLYLEHPANWAEKHRRQTPFTVFSKSYCPYSKKAKALLNSYKAHYDVYEVDLHRTSKQTHTDDTEFMAKLLWDLTGHRTYPKVLEGPRLLVR
ncbi:hypothetical protein MYAM1_002742 [Malassezia yamatoensis]|uniref:Glutaredoxin domain-containing protein n=1 Tax=Malassezia yamatoensis TaxID=253288 RepID=A0AAJ5YV54_9BASI|nr:hypothetical protein MYAM1_002742 [Malassezia yamatoensis]